VGGIAGEGDSDKLIRTKALEALVLALPGCAFYPGERVSAHVRASFSVVSDEEIEEGLRRLSELVRLEMS
jgi:tryptophan aminotransferase